MGEIYRPTRAEIDLDALSFNLKKIKKMLGSRRLMFVVKANAYGHGIEEVSSFAQRKRLCDYLGVSSIEEGILLRERGIRLPILVLGSVYPMKNFSAFVRYNLIPTISSLWGAKELEKASSKAGKITPCHIKVETGMNRIGVSRQAFEVIMEFMEKASCVRAEGVYSHFSSADSDRTYSLEQLETFKSITDRFAGRIIRHMANSAGLVNFPQARFDMARCGWAAYGYLKGFRPVMSIKSSLVFIKTVRKGSFISYNKTYRAEKNLRVATVPVGYGDGYLRAFSNKAHIIVGGKKCPVIGNVTMDMIMADISGVKNAKVGDEAILMGECGREKIGPDQLASLAGTIGYEITTLLMPRVPRIYRQS
ncbi:MAG: alanine racemase [Elusimicrobiota bacterium]